MATSQINTIVISDNLTSTKLLKQALSQHDYRIIFEGSSLKQLLASDLTDPQLIIIVLDSTDLATLEQLKIINEQYPLPIVIFTNDQRDEAIDFAINVGVSAYIVDGLHEHRILPIVRTACARFQQHQKMQDQLVELRTTLAERKIIDRAKGLIMAQRQCSEDEAYKLLRTSAMQQNMKLAALSQNIIDAASLLSPTE